MRARRSPDLTRRDLSSPGQIEPYLVALLWGALSASYATFVATRWIASGDPPGLRTLNACGAVTAVWLYFPIRYRDALGGRRLVRARAALLAVLALVTAGEWIDAAWSLDRSGSIQLVPAASAFVLTMVFRHLLLDLINAGQARGSQARNTRTHR